jgi:hypothetical protein
MGDVIGHRRLGPAHFRRISFAHSSQQRRSSVRRGIAGLVGVARVKK